MVLDFIPLILLFLFELGQFIKEPADYIDFDNILDILVIILSTFVNIQ